MVALPPLAIKILVLGGVGNLVLSFILGWVLSAYRMKGPMEPHRWLLVAHEVALQEGQRASASTPIAGMTRGAWDAVVVGK